MKKSKVFFSVLVLILISVTVFADEGKHSKSIDEVIELILEEQKLENKELIDPDSVSDELLELLGEAYMIWMHPNEEQHEWMDKMMGGEGSESLRLAHIRMGYSYLDKNSWGFCGRGMMRGPGMMGWWGKK